MTKIAYAKYVDFTFIKYFHCRQQHMCHMHRHWVTMAISSLPYVGNALRQLATNIVNQTCRNLELLAVEYTKKGEPVYVEKDQ